jgi:hypothetical protein
VQRVDPGRAAFSSHKQHIVTGQRGIDTKVLFLGIVLRRQVWMATALSSSTAGTRMPFADKHVLAHGLVGCLTAYHSPGLVEEDIL